MKKSGLRGIYFDENYLSEEFNYLTGSAYLLPNEQVQPGYSYLGLRDYDKRLRYMFESNGVKPPYLWLHTTSGHPVYAWMPDVAMEGENVEPTGQYDDYMDGQSAARLRAIGMGANLGAAPTIMCQSANHWNPTYSPFLVHQFVGWIAAHDCLAATVPLWWLLTAETELWREDVRFLPYWKSGQGLISLTNDVVVSAHLCPGHAVLWIANTAHEDRTAVIALDLKKLGFSAKTLLCYDTETGEIYPLHDGKLTIAVPKRMWRSVRLLQRKELTGDMTFIAHFAQDAVADEALGNRYPPQVTQLAQIPKAIAPGPTGKGLSLAMPIAYAARQHVTRESGAISLQLFFDPAKSNGTLLAIDKFRVTLGKGRLTATLGTQQLAAADLNLPAGPSRHGITVSWLGQILKVQLDNADLFTAALPAPMPIQPTGRGLEIIDTWGKITPTLLTFGPVTDGVMDELVMRRK